MNRGPRGAVRLPATSEFPLYVLGRNGAGNISAPALQIGDRIKWAVNLADGPSSSADMTSAFRSVVTVNGQLRQVSSANLSAKAFLITVVRE